MEEKSSGISVQVTGSGPRHAVGDSVWLHQKGSRTANGTYLPARPPVPAIVRSVQTRHIDTGRKQVVQYRYELEFLLDEPEVVLESYPEAFVRKKGRI